jgi:outer membrane murein-binding lipoprotein Lpp
MKSKLLFFAVFSALYILTSCSKDEENPVVQTTYTKDVKSIFVSSCAPCHVSGGVHPSKFDDYATAKSKIDAIVDRVHRDAGAAGFMPKNGSKLSAETIAILTKWKSDGLPEN